MILPTSSPSSLLSLNPFRRRPLTSNEVTSRDVWTQERGADRFLRRTRLLPNLSIRSQDQISLYVQIFFNQTKSEAQGPFSEQHQTFQCPLDRISPTLLPYRSVSYYHFVFPYAQPFLSFLLHTFRQQEACYFRSSSP